MPTESPYKDLSPEMLLAKTIELQDRLDVLSSKPKRGSFVLRYWHAVLISFTTSIVCATGLAFCAQAAYDIGKPEPIFVVPCIVLVVISAITFIISIGMFADNKMSDRYI